MRRAQSTDALVLRRVLAGHVPCVCQVTLVVVVHSPTVKASSFPPTGRTTMPTTASAST